MSIVVDFAWTKPSTAQLKSWGAVAAFGYVSHDASKSLSAAIVRLYAAQGIKSGVFFEDTADRAAAGYAAGVADARFAIVTATGYGLPSWAPVIVAVDFDIPDYAPNSDDPALKLGPVGQYLKGWCDTIGKGRTGVYGGYWAVTRAIAAGLAAYGVQTIAWSGGQADLNEIATLQNGQMLGNGQVDVEVVVSSALLGKIAWTPGEANPAAPPAPKPAPPQPSVSWTQWPPGTELAMGAANAVAVKVLQTALRNSGIYGVRGITVDGSFGNQTRTALGNFQVHEGLAEDWIAGPVTRTRLARLNDLRGRP
jgi:hypothetical protein